MVKARFLTVFMALLLVSSGALAQRQYKLTATIDSEGPNDGIAGGIDYNVGPVTVTIDEVLRWWNTHLTIAVTYAQGEGEDYEEFHFGFDIPTAGDDIVGTHVTPDVPGSGPPVLKIETPSKRVGLCGMVRGEFTVSAADLTLEGAPDPFHLDHVRIAWKGKCAAVAFTQGASGTLELERLDGDSGSDPPGGGSEPPAPPPPPPPPVYVGIVAPPSGVTLGNSGAATVAISTTVHEGYEGPVHLEAFAPPGLEVTFEPQVIPSPGAGTTAMTIEVGEHVLPMRHLVEIRASGPPRPTSIVFPVELLCEPPFVSYTGLPNSTIVTPGGSTTLNIEVVGSAPLRYQWYEGPTGSIWRPIENATGSSLTVGPVNGTAFYWLRVTNGCGSWDSPTLRVGNSGPRWRPVR